MKLSMPSLEFAVEIRATIADTLEIGDVGGIRRRAVPITGGSFSGPGLSGHILPGGADWQLIHSDGLSLIDARYVLETEDRVRIEVRNQGVRHGPVDLMSRIAAGAHVQPDEYYFRTTPQFFAPRGSYEWLNRSVFVGSGERLRDLVIIRVWKVL